MPLDGEYLLQLVEAHSGISEHQRAILILLMSQCLLTWLPFRDFEWKHHKQILVKINFEIFSFKCIKLNAVKGAYIPALENTKLKIKIELNSLVDTSWLWMERGI